MREAQTKGGEELAVELQKQSVETAKVYGQKLREHTEKIKNIFDSHKKQVSTDSELLVNQARSEAENLLEQNRKKIEQNIQSVAQEIKAQAPAVALIITQKLIGK